MKKMKLSLIVVFAILGTLMTAFTGKISPRADQWYGQINESGPYDMDNPISDLNGKCPLGTAHICAVTFNANGTVKLTRKSTQVFVP